MKIKPEQTGYVTVFLTKEDLTHYGLNYQLLNPKETATRQMTGELLSRIQETTGIDFSKTRILMEAYQDGEGCILRIGPVLPKGRRTKKRYQEPLCNPVVFDFKKQEALLETAERLKNRFAGKIRRSALYRMPHGFRLLLYFSLSSRQPNFSQKENPIKYQPLTKGWEASQSFHPDSAPFSSVFTPYPSYVGQGILLEACAIEYGKPIAFSGALELLSKRSDFAQPEQIGV